MQLISQMNDKHVLSCIMLNNMTVFVISHSRMFLKMGNLSSKARCKKICLINTGETSKKQYLNWILVEAKFTISRGTLQNELAKWQSKIPGIRDQGVIFVFLSKVTWTRNEGKLGSSRNWGCSCKHVGRGSIVKQAKVMFMAHLPYLYYTAALCVCVCEMSVAECSHCRHRSAGCSGFFWSKWWSVTFAIGTETVSVPSHFCNLLNIELNCAHYLNNTHCSSVIGIDDLSIVYYRCSCNCTI